MGAFLKGIYTTNSCNNYQGNSNNLLSSKDLLFTQLLLTDDIGNYVYLPKRCHNRIKMAREINIDYHSWSGKFKTFSTQKIYNEAKNRTRKR